MQNEFFKFWEDAAKNYQKAFESWQKMIPTWDSNSFQMSQPFTNFLEQWFKGMSQMYMSSEEELKHKNQQMFGLFQDLEKKYLHVLSQMTADNMMKSYQKTFENATSIMQDAQNTDPKIVLDFFQKIMTEYLKDIEEIPDNAKKIDIQKLWEIWGKIFSGSKDEDAQRYFERFKDTMRVKMQYGVEYYADPTTTKVGFTPRNLLWKKGKYQLFHYPAKDSKNATPLLIVYSLINKPYILDLLPGCSVIEYFTQKGLDVYLIEWGETDYDDKDVTLDTLIATTINEIVDFIISYSKHPQVSILGHCVGGVLALLYASVFPTKVERLLTLTTPITGTDGGIVGVWAHFLPTDQILQMFGNMPAKLIRYTFIGLKPYYEVIRWKKFYENLDSMNDEALKGFYAVDKWLNDNIDVPGEIFRKFIQEIYQKDHLREGKTTINGQLASLKNITCPIFNIIADEDWIVTPESAKVLNNIVSSKENIQKIIPGQHLSIIFHPKNRPVWKEMLSFFAQATANKHSTNRESGKQPEIKTKENKKMRMSNKVVVVTGGANGIGKATVLKFAEEGATVCWCDLNTNASEELAKELKTEHSYASVNVAEKNAVREWIEHIVERYSRIDVLVNNAGITRDNFLVKVKDGELVKEMPEDEFDQVIDINLKGVYNCTQAVAPVMIKQNSGVILNAASVVALYGNIGQTNYVATKAGVIGMTQVWARELGRYNIRVNSVAPGFIATEMVKKMPEKITSSIAAKTPLQRLGEPVEIANTYLWLASDDASFITGTNISVDGGMVLGT